MACGFSHSFDLVSLFGLFWTKLDSSITGNGIRNKKLVNCRSAVFNMFRYLSRMYSHGLPGSI